MHTTAVSHFTPTIVLLSGREVTACAKNQFNIFTDKKKKHAASEDNENCNHSN